MARDENNPQPRWTEREDSRDWPDDLSRSRNYDREDMRRYGQRSVDQGDNLRRLRGMEPDRGERIYGRGYRPGQYTRRVPARPPYREGPPRNIDPDHIRIELNRGYRVGQDPWDDQVDNYWGQRAMRRHLQRNYRPSDRRDWRNSIGGRPDVTSGRYYTNDIPTRPGDDWGEDREYDLDPGFDYEFGTDFDFLDIPGPEDDPRQSQGQVSTSHRRDYRHAGREDWMIPGPFTGVGPQGYRPSDERITENVCETLSHSRRVDPSGLRVQVENGVVMLSGEVKRREEKYQAEDIAASVAGVTEVKNQIQVRRASPRGTNRSRG